MSFNWNKHKTDKLKHGYDSVYNSVLKGKLVNTVLEVGSRPGSAKLWLDYFPNANIYCMDLKPFNIDNNRFTFVNLNQSKVEDYHKLTDLQPNFDVIIDDGPHTSKEQLLFLDSFLSRVVAGGVYIIEDLHCTDGVNPDETKRFKGNSDITVNELLKEWGCGVFRDYKYIQSSKFKSMKMNIKFDRGTKIRWNGGLHKQKEPSQIFTIEVLI